MNGLRVVIVWPPVPAKRTWRERVKSRPFQTHHRAGNPLQWELVQANGGGVMHNDTLYCTQDFWEKVKRSTLPSLEKP